jgi:hypothetical protein
VRRKLEILSIKDANVVEFTDNHLTKEGEENSLRAMCRRMLGKRIEHKGQRLPVFIVKSVSPWALSPKEVAPEPDEFDEILERQSLPDDDMRKKWFAVRDENIAKSKARQDEATAQIEKQLGGEVAKSIQQMVKSVASQTTVAKGGPRG